MIDDQGREYKICQYEGCGKRIYKDAGIYNTDNWNKKKFCDKRCKVNFHNIYRAHKKRINNG